MKELKFILRHLLTVIMTSAWWITIMFNRTVEWGPLAIAIAITGSSILLVHALSYIASHWKEE